MDVIMHEGDYLFVPAGYVVIIRDNTTYAPLQIKRRGEGNFFTGAVIDVRITLPGLFGCSTAVDLIVNQIKQQVGNDHIEHYLKHVSLTKADEYWYQDSPTTDEFGESRIASRSFHGAHAYPPMLKTLFSQRGIK
jgi:hypothetical protein